MEIKDTFTTGKENRRSLKKTNKEQIATNKDLKLKKKDAADEDSEQANLDMQSEGGRI